MSWDTVPGRNGEGYPDPTASTALARVQHSQKGGYSVTYYCVLVVYCEKIRVFKAGVCLNRLAWNNN